MKTYYRLFLSLLKSMPKVEENALNGYEQKKLVFSYVDITMYRKVKHSLDCLCAFTISGLVVSMLHIV